MWQIIIRIVLLSYYLIFVNHREFNTMYGLVFRKKGGKYAKKRRKVGRQPNWPQEGIKPITDMQIS